MPDSSRFSRRQLFHGGAILLGGIAAGRQAFAQDAAKQAARPQFDFSGPARRSTVSLVRGDVRRKNVFEALRAIDDQIKPRLARKKYVLIKPNNVSTEIQLAATHADAIRGILDYLDAAGFKGPVMVAESSAGDTMHGFESFKYNVVAREHASQRVSLLDLNAEGKYEVLPVLDADLHLTPVRLAARLFDPEAFVISSAMLKTHNVAVATMGVKNMALGAPLHAAPKESPRWNDKRKYHFGVRQTHYSMMLTAQKLATNWDLSIVDGYEGMEGNGPSSGTPVASRLAIASTDFISADRIGVECMGINAEWLGYLNFLHQAGVGQYDLNRIDIRGEQIATVRKPYRLHGDLDRELMWMGPMNEIPPRLG